MLACRKHSEQRVRAMRDIAEEWLEDLLPTGLRRRSLALC